MTNLLPANNQEGFTLIELLVVIAIIGLLASVILVALNSARIKSRDAKRKADFKQISSALDFYYDKYGSYTQPENCGTDNSYDGCGGTGLGNWSPNSDLQKLVSSGFLKEVPKDPLNNATYRYTYEPANAGEYGNIKAGQAYDLCATLEQGGTYCINKR